MKSLFLSSLLVLSVSAFGYGVGYSSHPLRVNKHLLSTEFVGITSTGGGAGVQLRYTRKMSPTVALEGGAGLSGGKRNNRFFIGADMEFLPDYGQQPRVSMKANVENAKEFARRRNILSLAPTVSKGFSFWGHEAYPFLSLPVGLNLEGKDKNYETEIAVSAGLTGPLPIENYKHLLANFEAHVGLKDSYTAFFLGLTYQLN